MAKRSLVGVVALGAALLGGAMATSTYAAGTEVNVATCEELIAQFATAADGSTLKLTDNIVCAGSSNVFDRAGETLTIDMNGKTWGYDGTTPASWPGVIMHGGTLKVAGKGTINANGGKIDTAFISYASTGAVNLEVGADVTINAADLALMVDSKAETKHATTFDVYGDLFSDGYYAMYINGGNRQANVMNLHSGATAKNNRTDVDDAVGIYAAGNATWTIAADTLIQGPTAIALKAGTWNIKGGTIISTGTDDTPIEGASNGANVSGAAIQIESNAGYAGNIELNIEGGVIESQNGFAIYDFVNRRCPENATTCDDAAKVSDPLAVKNINITGGTFNSEKGMKISTELAAKTDLSGISGGEFEAAPAAGLIKVGYKVTDGKNDAGYYGVILNVPAVDDEVTNPDTNENKTNEGTLAEVGAGVMGEIVENLDTAKKDDVLTNDDSSFEFTVGVDNATLKDAVAAGDLKLVLKEPEDASLPVDGDPEKAELDEALPEGANLIGYAYDVDVVLLAKDGTELGKVTKLPESLKLLFTDVTPLEDVEEGYERTWGVILFHNGEATPLPAEYDAEKKELTTESNLFSKYVPYYVDTKKATVPGAPNTGAFTGEAGEETQTSVAALALFAATFAAVALLGYAVKTSKR